MFAGPAVAGGYGFAGPTTRPRGRGWWICACPAASRAISPMQVSDPTTSRALLVAKLGHRSVVNCAASGLIGARACFAEVAGVAEVLAGGRIRGVLQAHTAPTHGLPMLPMPRIIRT